MYADVRLSLRLTHQGVIITKARLSQKTCAWGVRSCRGLILFTSYSTPRTNNETSEWSWLVVGSNPDQVAVFNVLIISRNFFHNNHVILRGCYDVYRLLSDHVMAVHTGKRKTKNPVDEMVAARATQSYVTKVINSFLRIEKKFTLWNFMNTVLIDFVLSFKTNRNFCNMKLLVFVPDCFTYKHFMYDLSSSV